MSNLTETEDQIELSLFERIIAVFAVVLLCGVAVSIAAGLIYLAFKVHPGVGIVAGLAIVAWITNKDSSDLSHYQ